MVVWKGGARWMCQPYSGVIVAFIAGIDQFSFLESLYQPIVTGFLVGLTWRRSDWSHCWWYLSAMTIGNMPVEVHPMLLSAHVPVLQSLLSLSQWPL